MICWHQSLLLILYLTWSLPTCHSPHTPSASVSFQLLVLYICSIRIRVSFPFSIVFSLCANPLLPLNPHLLSLSDRVIQTGYKEKKKCSPREEWSTGTGCSEIVQSPLLEISKLDQTRPSAKQFDFDVGPALSKRLRYRSPFNLSYFMVLFNAQFLFCFSKGNVCIINSLLPVGVHCHSSQHRTGVTSLRSMKLQKFYSWRIKIKL